jgi:CDP-diacylglycerol--glycerol-3-phosphate 3-phosphatidyltransferase
MLREGISAAINGLKAFLVGCLKIIGANPNILTFIGLLVNIYIAWLFSDGRIVLAGYLMILSGAFDVLDGAVAKATGKITTFGGFFDSVIDRYSDLVIWLGIIIFYARIGNMSYVLLTGIGMIGSIMISYNRARAENIIDKCKVGFMERPERHITMMFGAMFNHLTVAIWILAITTQIDAFYRIWYTRRKIREMESDSSGSEGPAA